MDYSDSESNYSDTTSICGPPYSGSNSPSLHHLIQEEHAEIDGVITGLTPLPDDQHEWDDDDVRELACRRGEAAGERSTNVLFAAEFLFTDPETGAHLLTDRDCVDFLGENTTARETIRHEPTMSRVEIVEMHQNGEYGAYSSADARRVESHSRRTGRARNRNGHTGRSRRQNRYHQPNIQVMDRSGIAWDNTRAEHDSIRYPSEAAHALLNHIQEYSSRLPEYEGSRIGPRLYALVQDWADNAQEYLNNGAMEWEVNLARDMNKILARGEEEHVELLIEIQQQRVALAKIQLYELELEALRESRDAIEANLTARINDWSKDDPLMASRFLKHANNARLVCRSVVRRCDDMLWFWLLPPPIRDAIDSLALSHRNEITYKRMIFALDQGWEEDCVTGLDDINEIDFALLNGLNHPFGFDKNLETIGLGHFVLPFSYWPTVEKEIRYITAALEIRLHRLQHSRTAALQHMYSRPDDIRRIQGWIHIWCTQAKSYMLRQREYEKVCGWKDLLSRIERLVEEIERDGMPTIFRSDIPTLEELESAPQEWYDELLYPELSA